MLKRYIVLALAFSFVAISLPKCPVVVKKSSAKPVLTQAPAAVNQSAAAASTSPSL